MVWDRNNSSLRCTLWKRSHFLITFLFITELWTFQIWMVHNKLDNNFLACLFLYRFFVSTWEQKIPCLSNKSREGGWKECCAIVRNSLIRLEIDCFSYCEKSICSVSYFHKSKFFRNLHPPSTFRTGSAWYTGNDRPLTSYTPGSYRSRFDDNFIYRRSAYDVERPSKILNLLFTSKQ